MNLKIFYVVITCFILFNILVERASAVTKNTFVTIVCERPNIVFAKGQSFTLKESENSGMSPITIQLDREGKKARFKRFDKWSPWSLAQFTESEVVWDLLNPNNSYFKTENIFQNFEFWKFNLDLINRIVTENFVEKSKADSSETHQARGFSYPDCRKAEHMGID